MHVLLVLAAAFLGVSVPVARSVAPPREVRAEAPEPLLVVGADGLEWNVVLPLLRAGRMPNLAGLMQRGAYGLLETMVPTQSPRIWNTIATGKLPDAHGILGFVMFLDEAEGSPAPKRNRDRRKRLYTSLDRRAKAFWNVLSDDGVTCDTIGWWTTFPAEEVRGLMVAQCNTVQREGGMNKGSLLRDTPGAVHPAELEGEVMAVLDSVEADLDALVRELFGPLPGDLTEDERWHVDSCRWSLRADAAYWEIARRRVASEQRADVTAVYVGATDVLAHHFWHAHEPGPHGLAADSRTVRLFGDVVRNVYERFDAMLGDLLSAYPADANVVIVADHGHGPKPEVLDGGEGWFRQRFEEHPRTKFGDHRNGQPGVFVAAGPAFRAEPSGRPPAELRRGDLRRVAHVADVCPVVLALAGVPVGEDMVGAVPVGLLSQEWVARHPLSTVETHDDADWKATRVRNGNVQPPGSEERLEQLRELGYLGDD